MPLLSNTLSRFVIAFLPRINHLLISWLQSPSALILEPMKRKSVTTSTSFPSICHEVMGLDGMILVFCLFVCFVLILRFNLALPLSFSLIKRLLSSPSLSGIRVVSSANLRLLMSLQPKFIPTCYSSTPAFLIMCSAYRSNKQSDSRQPYRTSFSILNQSIVPNMVLIFASWPAYIFLRRHVRLTSILTSWRVFHGLL